MTNTTTNPSATPAFTITPRIASKLKTLGHGLGLTGYSVQRDDYELHPYGTINRPFYTYDMALDALVCCKAAHPDRSYHIQQFGHDAGLHVRSWQQIIDESQPFERAWYLQQIADCLNAYTLSDTATNQDLIDAMLASNAAADAIKPLLALFAPNQHGFSDAHRYYLGFLDSLMQVEQSVVSLANAEIEATA